MSRGCSSRSRAWNLRPSSTMMSRTRPNSRVRSKRRFSRSRTRPARCAAPSRTAAAATVRQRRADRARASPPPDVISASWLTGARHAFGEPTCQLSHRADQRERIVEQAWGFPASVPPGSGRRSVPGTLHRARRKAGDRLIAARTAGKPLRTGPPSGPGLGRPPRPWHAHARPAPREIMPPSPQSRSFCNVPSLSPHHFRVSLPSKP